MAVCLSVCITCVGMWGWLLLQDLYSHVEQLRSEDIAVLAQRMVTVSLELTTVLERHHSQAHMHAMPHRALYSRVGLAGRQLFN